MYQRKKNYVMAGVKYGIGAMHPETEKQIIESQIEWNQETQKKAMTFAAMGAGVGWFIAKGFMGALIGGIVGYFLPNLLKEVEVVKNADPGAEPQPEKPSGQHPDVEKEESF